MIELRAVEKEGNWKKTRRKLEEKIQNLIQTKTPNRPRQEEPGGATNPKTIKQNLLKNKKNRIQ